MLQVWIISLIYQQSVSSWGSSLVDTPLVIKFRLLLFLPALFFSLPKNSLKRRPAQRALDFAEPVELGARGAFVHQDLGRSVNLTDKETDEIFSLPKNLLKRRPAQRPLDFAEPANRGQGGAFVHQDLDRSVNLTDHSMTMVNLNKSKETTSTTTTTLKLAP